jgi:chromosome segregation ATPase
MVAIRNLEKLIELENNLKAQYQGKLDAKSAEIDAISAQVDAKSAEIESSLNKQQQLKATIAKQLEQITELSASAVENKRTEQLNRELSNSQDKLKEEVDSQKKRIKSMQKDLAEERNELKALKQFDPAKMKKNLDASKKKLAEKTTANTLMQKSLSKSKTENSELQREISELKAELEKLAPAKDDGDNAE